MEKEADAVDNAVKSVLANGYRTSDIYTGIEGTKKVSCSQMGDKVIDFLR